MPEWLHIIVRAILFLAILFFITKLIGKKQISELSFFEYVSGITIGSIAGEVIMGLEDNMFYGILGVLIFGLATFAVDILSLKSKKFRDIFEGKGTVLIEDGKILEENLKKEKYTIDDLSALLRKKNVFKTADVEFAVLEPKGDLSVFLKRENQPLTPKDLKLPVANEKVTQTIIMDGKILDDSLSAAGQTREWLNTELEKLGVLLENVFMAQVDSYGEITVDVYDDKLNVPSPKQRPLLLAMIKKCQADLELFALETESETAKEMYTKNAKRLKKLTERLSPYLREPLN